MWEIVNKFEMKAEVSLSVLCRLQTMRFTVDIDYPSLVRLRVIRGASLWGRLGYSKSVIVFFLVSRCNRPDPAPTAGV